MGAQTFVTAVPPAGLGRRKHGSMATTALELSENSYKTYCTRYFVTKFMTCNNDEICFQERVEQHSASGLQAVLLPPLLQHKVSNATRKRTMLDLRINS